MRRIAVSWATAGVALALGCSEARRFDEFREFAEAGRSIAPAPRDLPALNVDTLRLPDSLGAWKGQGSIAAADWPACQVAISDIETGEIFAFSHDGHFRRRLFMPGRGAAGRTWLGSLTWQGDSLLLVADWSRGAALLIDTLGRSVGHFSLPKLSDSLAPAHHLAAGPMGFVADQWFSTRIQTWSGNWVERDLSPIILMDMAGTIHHSIGRLLAAPGDYLVAALNRGFLQWTSDTLWFGRQADAVIQGYYLGPDEMKVARTQSPDVELRPALLRPIASPREIRPRGATRWAPIYEVQLTAFAARAREFALGQSGEPPDTLTGVHRRTVLALWNRASGDIALRGVEGEIRSLALIGGHVFLTTASPEPSAGRLALHATLPETHAVVSRCSE